MESKEEVLICGNEGKESDLSDMYVNEIRVKIANTRSEPWSEQRDGDDSVIDAIAGCAAFITVLFSLESTGFCHCVLKFVVTVECWIGLVRVEGDRIKLIFFF